MRDFNTEHSVQHAFNHLLKLPSAREDYEGILGAIDMSDLDSCASEESKLLLAGALAMLECALAAKESRETVGGEDVFYLTYQVESSDGNTLYSQRVRITPGNPQWGGTAGGAIETARAAKFVESFVIGLGVVRGLTRAAPIIVRGLAEVAP
jgi:hypothetical protein